ncbi:hypothetical protein BSKO_09433 [Bryopsis sp. KO-2023]|nr:hypothetical protein BSKO_09433 [Bryopsis sp. KO-2023]
MELQARYFGAAAACPGRRAHRSSLIVVRAESSGSPSRPGEKIERWLKTPFDVAALGPRVTVGALVSAPDKLQELQSDLVKIGELVQDPRSPAEKQQILFNELETRLSECIERGAMVEADVFDSLKQVLPEDLANALPRSEGFQPPPTIPSIPEIPEEEEPEVTYTSESVSAEQESAAVTGIDEGMASVEDALAALRSNTSAARENMLKLNLKEARDRLSTLTQEVQMKDGIVAESVSRAKGLVAEADAEI